MRECYLQTRLAVKTGGIALQKFFICFFLSHFSLCFFDRIFFTDLSQESNVILTPLFFDIFTIFGVKNVLAFFLGYHINRALSTLAIL